MGGITHERCCCNQEPTPQPWLWYSVGHNGTDDCYHNYVSETSIVGNVASASFSIGGGVMDCGYDYVYGCWTPLNQWIESPVIGGAHGAIATRAQRRYSFCQAQIYGDINPAIDQFKVDFSISASLTKMTSATDGDREPSPVWPYPFPKSSVGAQQIWLNAYAGNSYTLLSTELLFSASPGAPNMWPCQWDSFGPISRTFYTPHGYTLFTYEVVFYANGIYSTNCGASGSVTMAKIA